MQVVKKLLLTILGIVIIALVFFTNKTGELFGLIGDHGGTINAIVALLNFYFLHHFRIKDRKSIERDEKVKRVSFWYREIILDRNIDLIKEMSNIIIDEINKVSTNNRNDEKWECIVEKFNDIKIRIISSLNDELRMINSNLATELDRTLDDLQDAFTEESEDLFTCGHEEFSTVKERLLRRCRQHTIKFNKLLFDFEVNGYTYIGEIVPNTKKAVG